ncbi:tRNA isopentenyltransferase [Collybia nuda]|uniref:tRNA isopentenyltransferase n=1 Tax=Collybia nuda TaxID=64659 RepID=A0A9P5XUU0_9AGAR|nr:tRNA isopentenyltransferase [Collybia nuda]
MNIRPLITICGTTGVGKSNLAIELALHLARNACKNGWKGARIINADSMQVYSGLDIITNKVPVSERKGVEHLLMGFKAPGEQYTVGQWVQDALQMIEETHNRQEIPIVVGGTSYWIQHLMFPNRLTSVGAISNDCGTSTMSPDLISAIVSLPPRLSTLFNDLPVHPPSAAIHPDSAFDLYALLKALDPFVATRWHWKDTRKVLRSLCIIKESGRRASEIIAEQSKTSAILPRFRTLCFWLYAEPPILETRLNERVEKMIKDGLLDEVRSLLEKIVTPPRFVDTDSKTDFTLGIYQSIGFKEFHHYLSSSQPSNKAFLDAVNHMKLSTRQYAKRQISWIRNKLLPAIYSANEVELVSPTYLLDATDMDDRWFDQVRDRAFRLMEDFLSHKDLPDPTSLSENARRMLTVERKPSDPISVLIAKRKLICPICTLQVDRPFMIEEGREWDAHQKTRMHKHLASKKNKEYFVGDPRDEPKGKTTNKSDISIADSRDFFA